MFQITEVWLSSGEFANDCSVTVLVGTTSLTLLERLQHILCRIHDMLALIESPLSNSLERI